CNYASGKFNSEITVIKPPGLDPGALDEWKEMVLMLEQTYLHYLDIGIKAQIARAILPNCLKTEIVVAGNFREWRHFFSLRCSIKAHPQMQELAELIRLRLSEQVPVLFDKEKTL
ncbi:unnamed protein product, partial [marine sediment metagenome]